MAQINNFVSTSTRTRNLLLLIIIVLAFLEFLQMEKITMHYSATLIISEAEVYANTSTSQDIELVDKSEDVSNIPSTIFKKWKHKFPCFQGRAGKFNHRRGTLKIHSI